MSERFTIDFSLFETLRVIKLEEIDEGCIELTLSHDDSDTQLKSYISAEQAVEFPIGTDIVLKPSLLMKRPE